MIRTAVWACPRLAPGSGFGSVMHDKTVRNGVEPAQTAARSRPSGPKSLTRGWSWRPRVPAPSPPGPLSPASGGKGEHDTSKVGDRSMEIPLPRNGGGWRLSGRRVGACRPTKKPVPASVAGTGFFVYFPADARAVPA